MHDWLKVVAICTACTASPFWRSAEARGFRKDTPRFCKYLARITLKLDVGGSTWLLKDPSALQETCQNQKITLKLEVTLKLDIGGSLWL